LIESITLTKRFNLRLQLGVMQGISPLHYAFFS